MSSPANLPDRSRPGRKPGLEAAGAPAHGALPLRAALERGAFLTAANWPVILVDFTLEAFYKLSLAVPAVGGALMVGALVGGDVGSVIGEGTRSTVDLVLGSLVTAPEAFLSFLAALAVVAVGGAAVMLAVKAGTFAVLVSAERRLADEDLVRLDFDRLRQASAYRLDRVYAEAQRFGQRALTLAVWLILAYVVVGVSYLSSISLAVSLAAHPAWRTAWPLVIVGSTSLAVVMLAIVNLAHDLLRIVVLTDDCGAVDALRRLRTFVTADARQVVGIFSVIGGVTIVATAISVLATAGLTLAAWVPLVSLIVLPLQAAAWIVRGLIFQAMGLAALSAYQTQYRRFSASR
jgi:hypothetical protein